ncbi:MAG: thiamine phosphate synthase [Candidatus Eutrophobiaceae bacterium]
MLPEICLITPETPSFSVRLEILLQQGLRLVQYRCLKQGSVGWREKLDAMAALCDAYNASLLINTSIELWRQACPGRGLHLGSQALLSCTERPVPRHCLLSAACHDLRQLRHAMEIGVDFALLSPVAPTSSHPRREPIGWRRFRAWVAEVVIPVYALGGMSLEDLPRARANGAAGIAMISGICNEGIR